MLKSAWSTILSYGIAVISPLVALMIELLIRPVMGETPFLLFVGAVMISSWYGGLGPGMLAIALSVLASTYFLVPPIATLDMSDWNDTVHLGIFIIVASLISSLHSRIRSARAEAEQLARSNQVLLLSERQARADAEASTRVRDDFLAMVSHELRNPLNSIAGWLAILRRSGVSDVGNAEHALGVIERNVNIQKLLIEDLLDLSQIAAGKLRIGAAPVDMLQVVSAAVESIQPSAREKEIRVTVDHDPSVGLVSGDAGRLHQVTWNLLSNAVKFTPVGGSVMVRLGSVDGRLQLSVSDTGMGIPADFLPRIFDRFSQSEEQNARRFGGLGLGLSISRHLVELHCGSIEVASNGPSGGSTFIIVLPLLQVERSKCDASLLKHPRGNSHLVSESVSA